MPQVPDTPSSPPGISKGFTDSYTLLFTAGLCIVCAIILSVLAGALHNPQKQAKDVDQNQQMLIAARCMAPEKHFLVPSQAGQYVPANFDAASGCLRPCELHQVRMATAAEIERVVFNRFKAVFIDTSGVVQPFESPEEEKHYLETHQKLGYAHLPKKLLYLVLPNLPQKDLKPTTLPDSFLLPVNGAGLWGPIYGYLALQSDGDTVIGSTWYLQGETPGLGANISEPSWQAQFAGKKIFQRATDGTVNYNSSPVGLVVVKGRVIDLYGKSPEALSALDGMSGATLTGNGVTGAYKDVLSQYRPFLAAQHQKFATAQSTTGAP